MTIFSAPLGLGIGLRRPHYDHVLEHRPPVGWFEVISENFMATDAGAGGPAIHTLEQVRSYYPVVMHGVSLSVGSADPLNRTYLKRLKALADRIEPAMISDHLCWTGVDGENLHDLLPLPYTEAAIRHVVERVQEVQEFLGRRILLENVSSYLTYAHSEMEEWEFITEIARRADCGILLDINNIYVSARNHGFDPLQYLDGILPERVGEFHLAGYSEMNGYLLDTHDHPVYEAVWALYREALRRFGPRPTVVEWDEHIPEFAVLEAEVARARLVQEEVLGNLNPPTATVAGAAPALAEARHR